MKIISTTNARKNIGRLVDEVKRHGRPFGLGRHNRVEALIIKYPEELNQTLNEITNINGNSSSFDFLKEEPDLYNKSDLKKRYV